MTPVKQAPFLWKTLPVPFTVLAPMEDVTDTVFRQIVASCARPDVFFTEFTSIDGLFSAGRDEVAKRFRFTDGERPIIAQVWGNDPVLFKKAAQHIVALGFDGMDINMGCPQRNITSHGGGAKLIGQLSRVAEIVHASREGLQNRIPLSIKTRLGYKKISPEWIPFLLEQHLDAITIHGRTASELSRVPAHWDEIGKYTGCGTVIIGNGDVENYADAVGKHRTYGVDGVMIGRGIFHDLWAFSKAGETHMDDRARLAECMRKHIVLFERTWGDKKHFAVLKKFFKMYTLGQPHASDFRGRLMQSETPREALTMLSGIEKPVRT